MRLTVLLVIACLSGCTVVQSAQYAVTRYCAIPAEVRDANRLAVKSALHPNSISIECAE